jgi:hypothetical protein
MMDTAAKEMPVQGQYRAGSGAMAAADSPDTIGRALPIFLAHASPRFLLLAVSVATAVRLQIGAWSAWDLLPVLGLLAFWPIQEWLIHVNILHYRPRRVLGRHLDFRVPRSHREHHLDPWNYRILFIPFHSFVYSVPLLVGIWYLVTPTAPLAWTGITAHFLLALHYEWIHFLVHTRVRPRTRFYKHLWDNHRLHHFKNERYWYGVTRTEGDWIFGTAPEAREVPTSQTCRDLLAV